MIDLIFIALSCPTCLPVGFAHVSDSVTQKVKSGGCCAHTMNGGVQFHLIKKASGLQVNSVL